MEHQVAAENVNVRVSPQDRQEARGSLPSMRHHAEAPAHEPISALSEGYFGWAHPRAAA
jgi:hypothetical protein